jgi:glycosyltransferase involved in cell wall biosynthesis
MRVLHLGNTANNGYNNAKLQRRLGLEADVVFDETHAFSQPEWEDGFVEGAFEEYAPLEDSSRRLGWERPDFVLPTLDPQQARRFRGQRRLAHSARVVRSLPSLRGRHAELREAYAPLRQVLGADLTFGDVLAGERAVWLHRLRLGEPEQLFARYDVVQAYAFHALFPLFAPTRPFVAFEHGTLRDEPFAGTPRSRLLALAYVIADAVVITNPDVLLSAQRLGLERYVYVPHPVDETKFTPADTTKREGDDFVVFAPARQDWAVKGNDRALHAFGALAAAGVTRPVLVLTEWGVDLERSRALVRSLGLEELVRWTPPFPKRQLIDAYRSADVVVDQFLIPTFGGIAPEAMACGRPVVTAYDPTLHAWCLEEDPPILPATTAAGAFEHLRALALDEEQRGRVGRAGRAWVERHHGWRLVAERQARLYESLLASA